MPPTVEIPDLKSTFACEEAPSLARLLFPHQEIMAQGSPVTAQCGYINLLDMGLSEMTINRTLGRERERAAKAVCETCNPPRSKAANLHYLSRAC